MNDDAERLFERVSPRGAQPELRRRVLDAVGQELAGPSRDRWERRLGLAVAASLLLSVTLNVWAVRASNGRRARLYGAPPVPRQVAEICHAVESVTDAETGRRIERELLAVWRSRPVRMPHHVCSLAGIPLDSDMIGEVWHDEKVPQDPEMDRDRGRRPDRDTSARRRRVVLDFRTTA